MIDLHLHTNASDGTLSPTELMRRAAAAGLTVVSVTDHDTVAGLAEARAEAEALGLEFIDGIEITAVEGARDVHVLGYFFDIRSTPLASFLEQQRAVRVERVREIAARLRVLGCPVDADALIVSAGAATGRSLGRPVIADALVAAGHTQDRQEAFDRYLGEGQAAFVPRCGASPETVVELIASAGGTASLAHPGLLKDDAVVLRLAAAGLPAVEVTHSKHEPAVTAHYRRIAHRYRMAPTGGSDFHGDSGPRAVTLGSITLEPEDFAELLARRS